MPWFFIGVDVLLALFVLFVTIPYFFTVHGNGYPKFQCAANLGIATAILVGLQWLYLTGIFGRIEVEHGAALAGATIAVSVLGLIASIIFYRKALTPAWMHTKHIYGWD